MLKELRYYENLGTPKFFHELFQQLSSPGIQWTRNNIKEYFYNRIVDEWSIFDGCLPLAEAVGAVIANERGLISLNPSLHASLINEGYLSNKLLEMILIATKNDDIFYDIFCPSNISYDIIYRLIQIENSAFHFRYANFRQLLINFNFLHPHPDRNIGKFIINSRYKKLFDKELMPEIKKRKIGFTELEKMLEQKQIYGREAEEFALEFERKRLISHPNAKGIEIISEYDIAAGYDITSFESTGSIENDRFIEVKSFSGILSFHWSRNEIDVARIKKDKYLLYLVDRNKMKDSDYSPIIIQNPYDTVMQNNQWTKKPDSYFISKNE